ncbi:nucleotide exchange factor GrpE [Streptosporangium sp. DT93]|uniref:nucleotide exchange factor GrpE n=1 Tax=Streptosporangium sp. DT93 TaxID=3393428 RepID=UPI003CF7F921
MIGEGPPRAGADEDHEGGPRADPAPPAVPGSTDREPADPGAIGQEAIGQGTTGQEATGPETGEAETGDPGAGGEGAAGRGTAGPEGADAVTAGRLAAVESAISEFNRRSAHRETVIDRLHEENQALRGGLYRTILEPVVADLIRMHDALLREVTRLTGQGGDEDAAHGRLLASFADDALLMLERCGLEEFTARPGEPFDAGRHTAVSVVPVTDEALDNTVAEVVSIGFVERETGQVRRPVRARFHRHRRADGRDPAGAPDERDPTDMT